MTMPQLPIPDPPEGEGEWKYALVGKALADTDEGKDLISRLEESGVLVEVMTTPPGDGYQAQYQPTVPDAARLRAFKPEEGIVKP